MRPPSSVYLIITQVEQPALPSPSTQPVSGDTQLESTHHVVVLLAAAVVVGGLAKLVPATTVRVMTTAATTPSLRIIGIMTPTVVAGGSRNGILNDDLTPDCVSV